MQFRSLVLSSAVAAFAISGAFIVTGTLTRPDAPVREASVREASAGTMTGTPTVPPTVPSAVPSLAAPSVAPGITAAVAAGTPAPAPPPAPVVVPADNPLAGRDWGTYKGSGDQAWEPYARSSGENRRLLGKIALTPKAKWFGAWISDGSIEGKVRDYVRNASGGNRDVLVQLAVFRMQPWEHEACRRLPSGSEQASYKRWIDSFAAGIGAQHAAIILQPDGPFAMCVPKHSRLPSELIAYSAKKFSALPHTSVYIDGGAADWPASASQAVDFLLAGGVTYARGIALDSTHYTATGDDIDRGTEIIDQLAARGAPGKKMVINTSSNGKPFTFDRARGSDPDNAGVCRSKSDSGCVTLGIPPTTDVANATWNLTAAQRRLALKNVDAYLWFGRPWLYRQADPFDLQRALQLVRTTPY